MTIRNQNTMGLAQKTTESDRTPATMSAHRKKMQLRLKPKLVAIYLGVFLFVLTFAIIGHQVSDNDAIVASTSTDSNGTVLDSTSVDEVIATSVAAEIAQSVNLPVVSDVNNLATSAQITSEISQTSNSTAAVKPQILSSDNSTHSTSVYTVQEGDTVATVAAQFNLSSDTIKWANNLTSDALVVGNNLTILPTDGVLYKVKEGDTTASIAAKYGVDETRLVTYNDLEVSGLVVESTIILPNGVLPTNERPGYTAVTTRTNTTTSSQTTSTYRSGSVGNKYAAGNCTWYAYERRMQLGNPVGSYWGNAGSWAYAARANGYLVNNTPSAGAVLVMSGHVSIVESVNADGSINISEMNNYAHGGWNIVSTDTYSAAQASRYQYVH